MDFLKYCTVENNMLKLRAPLQKFMHGNILTDNESMVRQLNMLDRSSGGKTPFTILGDKGSGKSTIAKYAHSVSCDSQAPFVKVNCSHFPSEFLEQKLFGLNSNDKSSLLSQAVGGSLYIENIDRLSKPIQSRLMDYIDTIPQTKFIVSLSHSMSENRESLLINEIVYYFSSMIFEIPPLRQRPEDIVLITFQQLQKMKRDYGLIREVSPAIMKVLLSYDWPTNIRQLQSTAERLALLSDETVINSISLLQSCLHTNKLLQGADADIQPLDETKSLKSLVQEYEIMLINQYIEKYGSIRKAATALKSSSSTLSRKIIEYYDQKQNQTKE